MSGLHPLVPYTATDRLLPLDFTAANTGLDPDILADTRAFSDYVDGKLAAAGARYGIGGYNEHRTVYSRSRVFDAPDGGEPRRLHLGIDIWGPAGTPVFAPLDGRLHSFAFNDAFGDYGATLILEHRLQGVVFHTLYGHLSLRSLVGKEEGQAIAGGTRIADFGPPPENGHWPPHLHFQVVLDMEGMKGDYPGVCRFSGRERFLKNCPDPAVLLEATFGDRQGRF